MTRLSSSARGGYSYTPVAAGSGALIRLLRLDIPLVAALSTLAAVGLVILYSAGGAHLELITRQGLRLTIGLGVMLLIAQIPARNLKAWSPWLYFAGMILLLAVMFFGEVSKGAQRWLNLGVLRFQPSELMKLVVPMMVAWYFAGRSLPPRYWQAGLALLMVAAPVMFIAEQPDLGTALLVGSAGAFAIFLAGVSWQLLAAMSLSGLASAPLLWHFLRDYQRQRILTMLDPENDPLGAGYHIIQSKIAIGSGGLYGKGWLNGTQSQLDFLPERHTDFIFAVFGEEWGFMGVMLLLLVYASIVWRGLLIAVRSQDSYTRLLAGSLSLSFFVYVFVNIGMVSGLLPVVGVPLPLISYGGTSVVTLMAAFGMLMSMHSDTRHARARSHASILAPKTMNITARTLIALFCTVAAGVAVYLLTAVEADSKDYLGRAQVRDFIDGMVSTHGFDTGEVERLFAGVDQQETSLEAIARPAEAKPWHEYREIFITQARINGGVEFWDENRSLLERASREYGVPVEIIVAIIGVETYYGRQTGDYPVFDTLVTLGFDYPPRGDFFRSELEHFMLLSREESLRIPEVVGSYAGAMGMGQFIPSSYRAYAVDFDGDGKRELWNSTADAIGSVANYFRVHGWQEGAPVAYPAQVSGADYRALVSRGLEPSVEASRLASLGVKTQADIAGAARVALFEYDAGDAMQYWVGLNNFYVITRYNHSSLYAMAVYQLSQQIRQAHFGAVARG